VIVISVENSHDRVANRAAVLLFFPALEE